jgi:hypothetical protein
LVLGMHMPVWRKTPSGFCTVGGCGELRRERKKPRLIPY